MLLAEVRAAPVAPTAPTAPTAPVAPTAPTAPTAPGARIEQAWSRPSEYNFWSYLAHAPGLMAHPAWVERTFAALLPLGTGGYVLHLLARPDLRADLPVGAMPEAVLDRLVGAVASDATAVPVASLQRALDRLPAARLAQLPSSAWARWLHAGSREARVLLTAALGRCARPASGARGPAVSGGPPCVPRLVA